VSKRHLQRKDGLPKNAAEPLLDGTAESRASNKVRALWKSGALFHVSTRYPRRPDSPKIDRLAGILRRGLLAPAECQDGSVRSDLHIVVTGPPIPYDSLVFLHRFGSRSYIYTICEPGRFAVFVDPSLPVLTQRAMGSNWVVLCQDEVYVPKRVELEKVMGIAIHPADADSVIREFLAEFRRAEIPLYDYDGNVLWPHV
jgi:hypothetical protein